MHRMCNGLPWMTADEEQQEFLLFWERAKRVVLDQGLAAMSGDGSGEVAASGENSTSNSTTTHGATKRDLYDQSQQQLRQQHNYHNNSTAAPAMGSTATRFPTNYPQQSSHLHMTAHGPVRDPYASRTDPPSPHDLNLNQPSSPSSPPAIMKRPNRDPYAHYYETKNDEN